jgi:hypothetical protein
MVPTGLSRYSVLIEPSNVSSVSTSADFIVVGTDWTIEPTDIRTDTVAINYPVTHVNAFIE